MYYPEFFKYKSMFAMLSSLGCRGRGEVGLLSPEFLLYLIKNFKAAILIEN